MKNIQVRVEDGLKEKSDKLFNELGTTTNEAIKIFLKTSLNEKGFPFELKLKSPLNLMEWVESNTLDISEKRFLSEDLIVEGQFKVDLDYGPHVMNEQIDIKDVDDNDDMLHLAQARLKIIDTSKVDAWEAADNDSSDYENVASSLMLHTMTLNKGDKVAIMDEFFVFSKKVSAKTRVKLFTTKVIPYLRGRDVKVVAFMNAGFWRTEGVEEQKALEKELKKNDLSLVKLEEKWNSVVWMKDCRE